MCRLRFHDLLVTLIALVLTLPWGMAASIQGVAGQEASPVADVASGPLILFAATGMSPAAVDAFSGNVAMPAFAALAESGASGDLVSPFPASASTLLPTLLTGAWPAEHGIVAEIFHRTGSDSFEDVSRGADPGLVLADTLPQAAERAGKQVVSIGWQGVNGLDPALTGPVVGDATPFSMPGVLTTSADATLQENATAHGVAYDAAELRPAEGWSGAPESFSPAQETELAVRSLDAAGANPDRTLSLYVFDSTDDGAVNYDQLLVATAKDAAGDAVPVGAGAWSSLSLELAGDRAGQSAGIWLKALSLAPDLSDFSLYYTSVGRITATWVGCDGSEVCAELGGFEEALNDAVGPALAVDTRSLAAGIIDAGAFAGQLTAAGWQAVDSLRLVVEDYGVQPDLLLLGSSLPALASQQTLAASPDSMADGAATPALADAAADAGAQLEADSLADRLLATGQELLGPETLTVAVTMGAFSATTTSVNAGQVLAELGMAETDQPANCVPGTVTLPPGTPDPEALPAGPAAKACWSGGTAHVYVNLNERESAGSVGEDDYEATREAIVAAFSDLADPENPDAAVVATVLLKEDLRDVGGADALHPSRAGDVVATLNPPYTFDGPTAGSLFGAARAAASDGFANDASGARLYLAGPGIAAGAAFAADAIDVAPTAAFLMAILGPFNASGNILLDAVAGGDALREWTILDISDFHGQLPSLGAAADSVGPSFDVGGVAYLGPWFQRYRDRASGPVLLVTAGDAVGATPPISTAFGDTPTLEIMNALGFTADALGNHNFDAGAIYMFGTLEPMADFPYLAVNLVPIRADVATPAAGDAPFTPSLVIEEDGVRLGLIGFSNPDIPRLTRPGAMDPYRVIDPVEPINQEASALRDAGINTVVAMGHIGATGGTLTEPTGPVVDVADQITGVDVVIADHTDMQVSSVQPNGVLLVENRSKGVMFTRVTLLIDAETGEVFYRTADHHRPWVIGMTPDAEIETRLEELEAELAPVLGMVIGAGAFPIPRSDECGMPTGRTCESLIGNIITDAMRITYGTEFAITNSGGIRADLTCPEDGGSFCPTAGDPNQITEGQVLTVLPFGNVAVTLEVTGEELKAMLETGVAAMPEASGAFPQVSGFCFTYDINAEPGNRVTSVVRQAEDGSCTGEVVDLSAATIFTLTTNDFTASGGDGYPELISRADSRDVLAPVVAGYVAGLSPLALPGEALAPAIQGRIVCEGEGCPAPAPAAE